MFAFNIRKLLTATAAASVLVFAPVAIAQDTDTLLADGDTAANAGDFGKALELFQKVCAQGAAKGCEKAGLVLASPNTGQVNLDAAAAAFEKGCGLGNVFSCARVQSIQDYRDQVAKLEAGCEADDGEACNTLGQLHAIWKTGDEQEIERNFAKACGLGDQDGCYNAAFSSIGDDAGESDILAAKVEFKRLCDAQHEPSCEALKKFEEPSLSDG